MRRDDRRMLTTLTCAVFVVLLNETVTGVSLVAIAHDLNADIRATQWATSGYMLTLAVMLPLTGWLLNRYPTQAVFRVACLVLLLGVAVSATAPTLVWLVAGRVLQAAGSVPILPMLLTFVLRTTTPGRRGRALSIVALTTALAPALGPTAAGFVLSITDWRGLFVMQVPLYLALFLAAMFLRRDLRTSEPVGRIDLGSVALSIVGFGGVVVAASSIGNAGGAVAITVGLLGIAGFGWRQLKLGSSQSTLDLSTFRSPGFARSVAVLTLSLVALFGIFALFPLLLLGAVGLTPLQAGLLMLPGGLAMGAFAPISGRATDRGRGRAVVAYALMALALSLVASAFAANTSSSWPIWLFVHLTIGIAFGFFVTPMYTTALERVPERQHAHASAILGVTQQLAAALGTASAVAISSMSGHPPGAPGNADTAISLLICAAFTLIALLIQLRSTRPGEVDESTAT